MLVAKFTNHIFFAPMGALYPKNGGYFDYFLPISSAYQYKIWFNI